MGWECTGGQCRRLCQAVLKYRDSISATSCIVEHSQSVAQKSVHDMCPSACVGASIGAAHAYQLSVSVLIQDGCAHWTGTRVDAVCIDIVHSPGKSSMRATWVLDELHELEHAHI